MQENRGGFSGHDYSAPEKSEVETGDSVPQRKPSKQLKIRQSSRWNQIVIERAHPELTGEADACLQVMVNEYPGLAFSMKEFKPRDFDRQVSMVHKANLFGLLCDHGYLEKIDNGPNKPVLYRLTGKHLMNPEA